MIGDEASVKQNLVRGADVDTIDAKGNTALYIAAEYGHFDVSKLLVESGASVDMANADGYTPLHKASAMGDYDTSVLLLEKGAKDVANLLGSLGKKE